MVTLYPHDWALEYQWITPISLGIRVPMNKPPLVLVLEYQWITPIGWVSEYQWITPIMENMENIFGLMTTELGRMASRAFEPDTPKIPKSGFSRIKGSKPRIVGTIAVPSWTDDEAGPTTTGIARTREVNPSMAGEACPFPESDDPEFTIDSMISSMTIEEEGTELTLAWRFCRYSSQSFLDLTDIAL